MHKPKSAQFCSKCKPEKLTTKMKSVQLKNRTGVQNICNIAHHDKHHFCFGIKERIFITGEVSQQRTKCHLHKHSFHS